MSETKLEALRDCEDYFDARADADHNGERYVGNTEMTLLTTVQNAIADPDPRITSADEMAKAVTEAVDAYDSGDEPNWKGLVHALRAALAAYNATRPLTGQEDARG